MAAPDQMPKITNPLSRGSLPYTVQGPARTQPQEYGPHKTLYNRWVRWSRMGVFATIMTEMAVQGQDTEMVMIDATHLKSHRTASSMAVQKGGPSQTGGG